MSLEERKQLELKIAQEEEEKTRLEKVKKQSAEKRIKKKGIVTMEAQRKLEVAGVKETQALETTKTFTNIREQATAKTSVPIQDSVEISAVASCKKVDETDSGFAINQEKISPVVSAQEPVEVTEVQVEGTLKDLKHKVSTSVASTKTSLHESLAISDIMAQESVKEFVEEHTEEHAKKSLSYQQSVNISEVISESDVQSFKSHELISSQAHHTTTIQKPLVVSEVQSESVVGEFTDTRTFVKAKESVPIQESVTVSEVQSESVVQALLEKKPKSHHAKTEKKTVLQEVTVTESKSEIAQQTVEVSEQIVQNAAQKVLVKREVTHKKEEKKTEAEEILEREKTQIATEVEELMNFIQAKEFGPGESPLRDLAQIGYLVRHGVTVNDITALYQADRFPALQTPVAQSALVQLVEREGHGALISQVLTEESTTDEAVVGETVGFRAFMRMVELKHAAVEEVITHFAPDDFRPDAWEAQEAIEVIDRGMVRESVEVTEETEVLLQEKRKQKKKTKQRQEVQTEENLEEIDLRQRTVSRTAEVPTQEHETQKLLHKDREEGVIITEIPVDEVTTVTEHSVAVVTHPVEEKVKEVRHRRMEDNEEEEELIIVEKKTDGVRHQRKQKKTVKQESEEEREIEIEIVERGKRKVKKTIKASHPDTEEEIIDEEFLQDLSPSSSIPATTVPLINTPLLRAEAIPEAQVAEMQTGVSGAKKHVTISLLTHSALSEHQLVIQEQENQSEDTNVKQVTASTSLEMMEPVEITEHNIEAVPGVFQTKFIPQTFEAQKSFISQEGIVVSETNIQHRTGVVDETASVLQSKAVIALSLQEATAVTEAEVSQRESDIIPKTLPKTCRADKGVTLQEGLTVVEVTEGTAEEKFNENRKPLPIKPHIQVPSSEHLLVSEVFVESKPGKYYPELFVATEVANKTFTTQQQITTEEMNVPEKEGVYESGRLPPSQYAGLKITPGETILVSETQAQENEGEFIAQKKPDISRAIEDFATLEGVSVSTVESQHHEKYFSAEERNKKNAEIKFTEKESLVTVETNAGEQESQLGSDEFPQGKQASLSVLCLETPGIIESTVQESEGMFVPSKLPTNVYAEISLRPEEGIAISEIQLGDTPSDYSEVLRYRTDQATPHFVTHEAMKTSLILSEEREGEIGKLEPLQVCQGERTYNTQTGISILQTQTIELEGSLPAPCFPDSHQVQTTPTRPLHSIIVQEMQQQGVTRHLEDSVAQVTTAKCDHDILLETVVEETVVGEALNVYKRDTKPSGKLAEIIVLPEESITITEIVTEDKEEKYSKPSSPTKCCATPDITGQKVAIKSEICPELTPGRIEETNPKEEVAKKQQVPLESLLVTLAHLVEKEGQFKDEAFPDTHQAYVELSESVTGLNVLQVLTHDRETEYISEVTPKASFASTSIPSHEVALKSETLAEHNVSGLNPDYPTTGRAKFDNTPFQELIVTETAVAEFEKSLTQNLKPEEKTAKISVNEGQGLSVIEVVASHKENILKTIQFPEERKAIMDIMGQGVALTEEIVADLRVGDWKRHSPIKEQARPDQEEHNVLITAQTTVGEKEGVYTSDIKPDKKQAEVIFEEGQILNVSEVLIEDKEALLEEAEKPKCWVATPDINTQGVALTSEVITEFNVEEIYPEKRLTAEAKSGQIPFESIILSETITREQEGEYIPSKQPQRLLANTLLQEEEGISVTQIILEDKEDAFSSPEIPSGKTAVPEIIGQEVASMSEVILGSCVSNLPSQSPQSAKATSEQLLFQSVVQSETALGELEAEYIPEIIPSTKDAVVAFEEGSGISVIEVIAEDREGTYLPEGKPLGKYAKPDIMGQEVAQKSEIFIGSSIEDMITYQRKGEFAISQHLPFEGIQRTEATVTEKEGEFKGKLIVDERFADLAFVEGRSITITQVTSEDKEEKYDIPEKPKECLAGTDVSGQEVANKEEVIPMFDVGSVPQLKTIIAKASEKHPEFESVMHIQTTIQESEGPFSKSLKLPSTVATVVIPEEQAIQVLSTTTEDKEDVFVSPSKMEGKRAVLDILSQDATEKIEVVTGMSVSDLHEQLPTTIQAYRSNIPYESVIAAEIAICEQEGKFDEDRKPNIRRAECDYEFEHSLNISLVTLSDKEQKFISPGVPKERKALPDICDSQNVVVQQEVFVDTAPGSITTILPIMEKAHSDREMLQGVVVSEYLSQENESEFTGKFKPSTRLAETVIEEGKKVQTVCEIQVDDKEGKLGNFDLPIGKKAISDIFGQEVAEKTEIITNQTVGNVAVQTPQKVKANVEQQPFESIVTSETIVRESEGTCTLKQTSLRKHAELLFEEGKSVSITEVVVDDKEGKYDELFKPLPSHATPEILGQEIAQKSEVLTHMGIAELPVDSPIIVKAKPEALTYDSLLLSETNVQEQEKQFMGPFKPDGKSVKVAFEEERSLNVVEIVTEDKEGTCILSEIPSTMSAVPNIIFQEVALKSEINSETCIGDVPAQSLNAVKADLQQMPFESIIQSVAIVQEQEKLFEKSLQLVGRNADLTFEEERSVDITHVTAELKETELDVSKFPKGKKAQEEFVCQESVQTNEVLSEMYVGPTNIVSPSKETAQSRQLPLESVIVCEDLVQEKESSLPKTCQPTGGIANIEFEEDQSVSVSEIILEDKEEVYVPSEFPKQIVAKTDFSSQEVAQKTEIHSEFNLEELKETLPIVSYAKPEALELEPIVQTMATAGEHEGIFEEKLVADRKNALLTLEGARLGASVLQILTEDKEGELIPDGMPKKSSALTSVSGQEVVQKTEIVTAHTTGEMFKESYPIEGKATVQQPLLESITMSETSVKEREGILQIPGKPLVTNAELSIEHEQSVTVIETVAEDKYDKLDEEKFIPKAAQPGVVEHEVALKTKVLPENALAPLMIEQPDFGAAKQVAPQHSHSVLITELQSTGEIESSLPDLVKPDVKRASVSFEQQEAKVFTEVHSEDREEILAEKPNASQTTHVTATQSFEHAPAVIVSETSAQVSVGEYDAAPEQQDTAIEIVEEIREANVTFRSSEGNEVCRRIKKQKKSVKGISRTGESAPIVQLIDDDDGEDTVVIEEVSEETIADQVVPELQEEDQIEKSTIKSEEKRMDKKQKVSIKRSLLDEVQINEEKVETVTEGKKIEDTKTKQKIVTKKSSKEKTKLTTNEATDGLQPDQIETPFVKEAVKPIILEEEDVQVPREVRTRNEEIDAKNIVETQELRMEQDSQDDITLISIENQKKMDVSKRSKLKLNEDKEIEKVKPIKAVHFNLDVTPTTEVVQETDRTVQPEKDESKPSDKIIPVDVQDKPVGKTNKDSTTDIPIKTKTGKQKQKTDKLPVKPVTSVIEEPGTKLADTEFIEQDSREDSVVLEEEKPEETTTEESSQLDVKISGPKEAKEKPSLKDKKMKKKVKDKVGPGTQEEPEKPHSIEPATVPETTPLPSVEPTDSLVPEDKEDDKPRDEKEQISLDTAKIVTKKKKKVLKKDDVVAPDDTLPEDKIEDKPTKKEGKPKLKPILLKMEKKEIRPTKLKVVDVKSIEEVPLFAQIKLKKAPTTEKKEIKSVALPKVLLKSNIRLIIYPPEEHRPIFTVLDVYQDKGILSRNTEEALKIIKKKVKKVKVRDKEEPVLETPEDLHSEPASKVVEDENKETPSWDRVPKKPDEEQPQEVKIIKGKGSVPETKEPQPEGIKLKKIPGKPKEDEVPEKSKPKSKTQDEERKKLPKDKKSVELEPYKPQDIPDHDVELEIYEGVKPDDKKQKESPEQKKKIAKPKKDKPEPEVIQIPLIPGVPKKPSPPPEEDLTLKKKQGEPKEESPERITLKPIEKEREDNEARKEPEIRVSLEETVTSIDTEKDKSVKVKKIKKKVSDKEKKPEVKEEDKFESDVLSSGIFPLSAMEITDVREQEDIVPLPGMETKEGNQTVNLLPRDSVSVSFHSEVLNAADLPAWEIPKSVDACVSIEEREKSVVTLQEIVPDLGVEHISDQPSPSLEKALPSLVPQVPLTIHEIQPDHFGETVKPKLPEIVHATAALPERESVTVKEVETYETQTKFKDEPITTENVFPSISPNDSLLVTQTIPQHNVSKFISTARPLEVPEVSSEVCELSPLTIDQTIVSETPTMFGTTETPSGKATPLPSTADSISITEIQLVHHTDEDIRPQKPNLETAQRKLSTQEPVQIQEVTTEQIATSTSVEETPLITIQMQKQNKKIQKALNVTEVTTDTKEISIEPFTTQQEQATVTVSDTDSVSFTQINTGLFAGDISVPTTPKKDQVSPTITEIKETIVMKGEENIDKQQKRKTESVITEDRVAEDQRNITKEDSVSQSTTQTLKKKKIVKPKEGSAETEELKTEDLLVKPTIPDKATPSVEPHSSVQGSEITPQDVTEVLPDLHIPETERAKEAETEKAEVTISEVGTKTVSRRPSQKKKPASQKPSVTETDAQETPIHVSEKESVPERVTEGKVVEDSKLPEEIKQKDSVVTITKPSKKAEKEIKKPVSSEEITDLEETDVLPTVKTEKENAEPIITTKEPIGIVEVVPEKRTGQLELDTTSEESVQTTDIPPLADAAVSKVDVKQKSKKKVKVSGKQKDVTDEVEEVDEKMPESDLPEEEQKIEELPKTDSILPLTKSVKEKSQKEKTTKDKLPQPKKVQEKPQLMKIERKEIKPTKMKITEVAPQEEVPLFAQVKLRKSSIQKREIKTTELPKVMLKSNIKIIEYPPVEQIPTVTEINAKPEKGILFRNTQEAIKLKKPKSKRTKVSDKEEFDLEEPEKFEFSDEDKPSGEIEEPDKGTWERAKKPVTVEDVTPSKLVIGKGKVPEKQEEVPEEIKLKKVPEKPADEDTPTSEKPKKTEPEEEKPKTSKEKKRVEGIAPFVGGEIEDHELELEKYEKVEPEKPTKGVPEEKKTKKKTPKPAKPEPEVVEIPLILGKPKKPPEEEEKDINLKKKMGVPVPEDAEQITLKPFTKDKPDAKPDETIISPPESKPKDTTMEEQDIALKLPKKRKSVKKGKPEDQNEQVEAVVNIGRPKIDEPEEVSEEISLKPKKKPEEESQGEITIRKMKPKEPESEEINETIALIKPKKFSVEDTAEEVTILKKKPVTLEEEEVTEAVVLKRKTGVEVSDVVEEIYVKKLEPVPQEEPDDVENTITLKKKKTVKPVTETVTEEITLKKRDTSVPEVVSEDVVLKVKKERPSDEGADEITVKKVLPLKPKGEDEADVSLMRKPEDVTEEITIKKVPKKKPSIEEHSEEVTLKPKPKKKTPEEVTEVETVMIRPRITKSKEEIEQEFKIQLQTYEEEDISMSSRVRLKKHKPKTYGEETGEETIRITREIEEEGPEEIVEIFEDEPEEDVIIELKRKPSYQVEEPEDQVIQLSRPRKPSEDVKESFQLQLKQRKEQQVYSVEDVEEEFKIGLKKEILAPRGSLYEEESLAVKLKPKEKPPRTLHQEAVSLSITRETEVFEEGVEEVVVTEYEEGDKFYSLCSYVADNEDALNLVEGERVYILETHNSDWWFVRKHLTEQKGWVPAQLLMDGPSYTLYVQRKLHEKIDKLPVFDKPVSEEKVSAPRFVEKLQPKTTPDGRTIQFECQVEGYPRPQIAWFRQTAIILPSEDFQIYYDDDNVATLIIKEAFPEDAGTYTCVAKNAAGFASSSTELIVEGPLSDHGSESTVISRKSLSRNSSLADILEGIPPIFSRKPQPLCVNEGTDVEIECRLVAVPEPDVIWQCGEVTLQNKDNVTVINESDVHMYSSILRIKKVKKNQEGVYHVVARNREGESKVSITLKVNTEEKEPPQVLEPLQSVIVNDGEGVLLSTQILGNPPPKVTWLKDGKPLKLPVKSDGVTHTLTLPKSSVVDGGVYSVQAVNSTGSAETTATVIVKELPGEKMEPPLFVERFQEEKIPEKGKLRLTAKVTGKPIPQITWLRNNQPLKPSPNVEEFFDGENIVLEIKNVNSEEDAGDYKCIASNPVGKSSHGAKISVDVEKVSFTRQLENVTVDETDSVNLECETSHTVSTKWFHDGKELSGMDHRVVIQEGRVHRLVIKEIKLKDKGTYKCTVKKQSTSCTVNVHETKADFVRKLQDLEVKEREMAVLEVEVSSDTADVTWHKDGEQINEESKKFEFEKQGLSRRLLIRGTSVHDEGEYTCVLGEQECTAEVTVVELPPELITKMQDVTIAKGEKATFEIELTKGDALVRWFKDGKELQFSEHVQLSIDGKRQKLKVYNSELDDCGEYSCQVGNQTSSAHLSVEEPVVEFITRLPDVTLIPLNMDATFTVELSRPDVDVKWFKKGKEIKADSRTNIITEGTVRKLVIKKVSQEDQTDYSCVAINVKTSSKLKVEIIETAPKINVDALQKIYKVKKGEDVDINVKFTATPTPQEEWSVNGKVVVKSKRISSTVAESSASLTVRKVQEEDVGSYKIKLVNNCGEASAELNLVLMEVPSQPGIPDVVEMTNESVTLHWKAPDSDGNSPIITYKVEYCDRSSEKWTTVNENFSIVETTYKITKLVQNNEYKFRITAVNEVGPSQPSESSQFVKVMAPVKAEPPVVQEPLKSVVTGLRQTITLSCVIGGIPLPEITWFKDGKIFQSSSISYENCISKYFISESSETTSGVYCCQAKNNAGLAETTCEVKIQEPPKIEYDETLTTQKLRVTNQWKIEVKYSGYPKPDITWMKNGKRLSSSKHCSIQVDEYTSHISISSLSKADSGTYTLTAQNEAGSRSVDFTVRVIDKPSKPEGPMVVKDIRRESVVIEWKPPVDDGGLELSKYSVEKCDVEKMVWMKVADVEKDVSSYCVQQLKEDAEYMFRVIAENPVGTSEALESDTVTIRSKFDKPSPPRGPLDISGMTEVSFIVAWQPPESDGGSPILEYIVERRELGKKAWQRVGNTTSEITHIEVTGLKRDVSYHFRITVRNDVGVSAPFAPEDPVTAGKRISAPSAPTHLTVADITSKSVTLQWGPPLNAGGTELTGYIIEKRLSSSKTWTKVVTLEPTASQHCIENLKEKSEFFFRVYAENSIGLSPPASTELVRLKTHASPPSPPSAPLEIRSIGPHSIIIEWGIPETDGGAPIEGYTIAIRDIKKTMWMEVGRVKADVQKLNIKDLQENHEYLIRIFARNEVGLSEPLESDEPFKVLRPTDEEQYEVDKLETTAPTLSFSTETTTSWMREAGMDADIHSYARGSLLRRDEYFFRIWYYARQLFK